jgi:hypothetical protein
MSGAILSQQKLFGLLELDAAGTVLYSILDGNLDGSAADVAGHNFYSEVAPFINVEEFHKCLDTFNNSTEQAKSFAFDCAYEDGAVAVRVVLARIREVKNGDTKSLLVHIKKAD